MSKLKAKGRFVTPSKSKPDLRHSLMFNICADAVKENLRTGASLEQTIYSCTDINAFLITQAVKGNFRTVWNGEPVGKLVRFYKSTSSMAAPIIRVAGEGDKGNTGVVANSDNCIPLQDLPDSLPSDVDYGWYVHQAQEWLDKITRKKLSGVNQKVFLLQQLGYTSAVVKSDPKARPSRAAVGAGELDWNAMPDHTEIGISTGKKAGIVAMVDAADQVVALYRFDGNLPTKTRDKVMKDTGYRVVYGQNIRLHGHLPTEPALTLPAEILNTWINKFYTPAELKRAGVTL